MNTPIPAPPSALRPHRARLQRRGAATLAARGAWIGTALLMIGLIAAATPHTYARLQTVCTGQDCIDPHLTAPAAHTLAMLGLSRIVFAAYFTTLELAVVAGFGLIGGLLVWRRPTDRLALLAAFFLVAYGGATLVGPETLRQLAAQHAIWRWAMTSLDVVGIVAAGTFFGLFPVGHFTPPWTRPLTLAWGLLLVPQYLAPSTVLNLEHWPAWLQLPAWTLLFGGMAGAQISRYRHGATAVQRRQTKWVVFGLAAALAVLLALIVGSAILPVGLQESLGAIVLENSAWSLAMLVVPGSIGVAILHDRLWDIDLIINRTLVYGALTLLVAGGYALVVGGLGWLLSLRGNGLLALVGAGVVAILCQPLRLRLQIGVNHLLYGQRDDPAAVLAHLGRRLEQTVTADAILPTVVEAVRDALKLPYAAIALQDGEALIPVAAAGTPTADALVLPVTAQGEVVGQLVLAPRVGERSFTPAEHRLFGDLARQAGIAVQAMRLTRELQQAREQLVAAREEERRRLRRDLHDGLGPLLGSQTLTLTAVRKWLRRDPDEAEALLDEAMQHAQDAISDIRRVVYDLRPPALDDLGLLGALQAGATRAERGGLCVTLDAPTSLSPLPAAVEVACFRIVEEALTNVLRHARASTCHIRLRVTDSLLVEIRDDGRGLPADLQPGVGLASMRERATELGGSCVIAPVPAGGTLVSAHLPLPRRAR